MLRFAASISLFCTIVGCGEGDPYFGWTSFEVAGGRTVWLETPPWEEASTGGFRVPSTGERITGAPLPAQHVLSITAASGDPTALANAAFARLPVEWDPEVRDFAFLEGGATGADVFWQDTASRFHRVSFVRVPGSSNTVVFTFDSTVSLDSLEIDAVVGSLDYEVSP